MGTRTNYRLVSFCQPTAKLLGNGTVGLVMSNTVDFPGSVPELAEAMDGWDVVSHQLVPAGDVCFLTVLLRLDAGIPDSL